MDEMGLICQEFSARFRLQAVPWFYWNEFRATPARGAMPRLSIRIYFEPYGGYLGPGMAHILQGIEQHGSIRQAAGAMGMGYRKAWLLIRQMQDTFGGPVISTTTGGAAGGGATLTDRGKALLSNFQAVEAHAMQAAASNLRSLASLAAQGARHRAADAPPQTPIRRKRREPSPK